MPLKEKTLGPFTFKIDRPEGYTKKWPGGREFTYPCDYGYFPRLKGEDGEGLDAFVGDDALGHLESFQKLRRDGAGRLVPDETKFLLGVDDATREVIYRLYGAEVNARRVYRDFDAVKNAIGRFVPERKARYKSALSREDLFTNLETAGEIPVSIDEARGPRGGAYNLRRQEVVLGQRNPDTLAHELGHHHFGSTFLGKATQNTPVVLGYNTAMNLAPFVGGLSGAGGVDPRTMAYGAAGMGVLSALRFIPEIAASVNGHRLMRDAGADPEQLKAYRRRMLGNFGTYVAEPISSGVISAGLYGLTRAATNGIETWGKRASYRNPFSSVTPQGPQQYETQDDFESAFAMMRKQAALHARNRYGVNYGRESGEVLHADRAGQVDRAFDEVGKTAPGATESVASVPVIEAGVP